MAKREHFFEFNWLFLLGLVCTLASAWITFGWLFVLVASAVIGALLAGYYLCSGGCKIGQVDPEVKPAPSRCMRH